MGCNCGKGQTIAQSAARRGTTLAAGSDETSALVIGEPGGEVYRVRAVRPPVGLTVGSSAYVTGLGVPALIEAGDLIDITRRPQLRRIFNVGGMSYTDRQTAQRVSAATGQPIIEVA